MLPHDFCARRPCFPPQKMLVNLDVMNTVGQSILQKRNVELDPGVSHLELNVADLQMGSYFIRIFNTEGTLEYKRFIKN